MTQVFSTIASAMTYTITVAKARKEGKQTIFFVGVNDWETKRNGIIVSLPQNW